MMKKIAVFFVLMLFFGSARAYLIDRHVIQAGIAEDGTAKVSEKFFVVFRNAVDRSEFRQNAAKNGPSLDAWIAFDRNISTHIDSIKGGSGRVIVEETQSETIVEIEYETAEQVMKIKSETSRKIEWELNSEVLTSFESGGVYVIPSNADLSIVLPKNALLEAGTITPTPSLVSGNTVSWGGPINVSGEIVLNYSTEKQIAVGIGISKTLQDLTSSGAMTIIIIAAIIVLGIVYWKRKALGKRIEDYVVEHSRIESKPGKEDEELE